MEKILVIGAAGQIGSELVLALRAIYGASNVVASDIKTACGEVLESGPFETVDVLNKALLADVIRQHSITQVYHLAAILSGNAEKKPLASWDINMLSLMNVLEIAREAKLSKIFWPSSIAVFGPNTPRENTPQYTIMDPNTVYGISKLAGERWIAYYFQKYGLDVRSVRYPGLISYKTEAGGGTTDYAVEIFYEAIRNKNYHCFLTENTKLPMMFMDDAIENTIKLMNCERSKLSVNDSYNMAGISFDPKELSNEIIKHIPEFTISYKPDFRQQIADSWPMSINDEIAKKDWDMQCNFNLDRMTEVMINEIRKKIKAK